MLRLHVPDRAELVVRQRWLADPETMAYNARWDVSYDGYDPVTGCVDWPPSAWPAFEARLRLPVDRHGYFFVQDGRIGDVVGDASYEVAADGTAGIGITVVAAMRGRGVGGRALELLVDRVWRDTEARQITNAFEDERAAAVAIHRRCGFVPDEVTTCAWGRPSRVWRLDRPA